MTEIAAIRRFNAWRHWCPMLVSVDDTLFREVDRRCWTIPSHDVAAVYRYCALTGHLGIEFVVASAFVDPEPFRVFNGDIWLVPCSNVIAAVSSPMEWLQIGTYLYDGWLPLPDFEDATILAGLRKIDELVALISHVHRGPARWIVKYRELQDQQRYVRRNVSSDDYREVPDRLQKLHSLPPATRAATVRSMNWLESSRNRATQSDRFLSLWLATECLLLALYEDADAIGLPISDPYAVLSKAARRARRQEHIRQVLDTVADPEEAVKTAYFQCVTPIRRRMDAVLVAIFGTDDPAATWPYSSWRGGPAPADVRADMVHRGISGVDAAMRVQLDALSGELEEILDEAISRVIDHKWGGDAPARPSRPFRMIIAFDDSVGNTKGPIQINQRSSEITPELLWRKGFR